MEEVIRAQLADLERWEDCRILLAVESGSRAWGFASPDSDYDVRFLYVRPRESYFRLDGVRDVVELPLNDALDLSGWDLCKALRLLHRSNPTVFEWFASPIVYRTSPFAEAVRAVLPRYFCAKSSLWHYLQMARGNYREYLCGEMVRAKKYFYVLRPILACRWILETGMPPPMRFAELVESQLPDPLKETVEKLLELKVNAPEIRLIPKVECLNAYLEQSIPEIFNRIRQYPREPARGWEELNRLFVSVLESGAGDDGQKPCG